MGLGLSKYIPFLVYLACIIVTILILTYKKELGLYLITIFIPLQNLLDKLIKFPFGKDILDIIYFILFIKILIDNGKSFFQLSENRLNKAVFLVIPLTYTGLWVGYIRLGLSPPISFHNSQFELWKNFIMLPLLYFFVFNIVKEPRQVKIIIIIMIVTLFLMGIHYYNNTRYIDYSHFSEDKRTVGSTFSYLGPNEFAAFYAQVTMLFLGFFSCLKNKWVKVPLLLIISLNFYSIIYLFSRGGYFALLLGLVFLGLAKKRSILVLLVLLLLCWKAILPGAVVERIQMTKTEKGVDHSVMSRFELWSEALQEIIINPFTGMGFGSSRFLGFRTDDGQSRTDVHNGFIEITLEQGIVGLSLFLYIFIAGMKKGWILYKTAEDEFFKGLGLGFVGMIIAALSANLFGDRWSYFNVMGYFWVTLGLVSVSLKQIAEKDVSPHMKSLGTERALNKQVT